MSASVVISTPPVTPAMYMASRTNSCWMSSTREDDLLLRVVDIDVVVEPLLHDDVHVLVDGGVEDTATVLAIVGGQIRSAADEPDAQRSLGDDHLTSLPSHSSLARSERSRGTDIDEVAAVDRAPPAPCRPAWGAGRKPMSLGAGPTISSSTLG